MKIKILLSALLVALLVFPADNMAETQKKHKKDVCVQLYSLRSILDSQVNLNGKVSERYTNLFNDLAEMGFTSVEAANYVWYKFYNRTPDKFKEDCEKAGLQPLSSHVVRTLTAEELASGDFYQAMKWWKQCISDHKTAGFKYIVMPARAETKNAEEMLTQCRYFNEIGKLCKENGIRFGFHNHNEEFIKEIDGKKVYDWLLENTDPEYVFFQMDVYWAVYGHVSPVDYFKKYPGRFELLHIRDDKELGQSGMVGFDAIFNNAGTAGMKHFIIEVGSYKNPSVIEGMRESINYVLDSKFVKPSYCK